MKAKLAENLLLDSNGGISIENYPSPSPFVRLQESAPASKNGHSQQLEPYSPPAS